MLSGTTLTVKELYACWEFPISGFSVSEEIFSLTLIPNL